MSERATLDIPPDPATLSEARRFVAETLADWSPVEDTTEKAVLAVDELVTNAMQHARSSAVIILERRGSELVVGVGDKSTELPVPQNGASGESRGRGLRIVEAVASEWGAEPEHPTGKIVWAIFRDAFPSHGSR